jgi:hypothetical protein
MTQPTTPVYTALHSLAAPGTLVFGYHRGDPVEQSVVENWGLTVGGDVAEGTIEDIAQSTPVAIRPGPEANRAAWESYAIAGGLSEKAAAAAAIEELQAERDTKGKAAERPAGSKKATAPPVGDPVALAASEAIKGG